ncbi:MAG: hypothetical protein R2733_17410 [Acidimicrobiales bacterium]
MFYLAALGLLAGEVLVLTRVVNASFTIAMLGLWIYVFGPVLSDVEGRGRHDRLAGMEWGRDFAVRGCPAEGKCHRAEGHQVIA